MPSKTAISLDEHETKVRALQEALIAGEKSGESTPFDFEAFISEKRAGYRPN